MRAVVLRFLFAMGCGGTEAAPEPPVAPASLHFPYAPARWRK